LSARWFRKTELDQWPDSDSVSPSRSGATFLHQNLILLMRQRSSAVRPDFGFNSLEG
jgi:hypothetical protein